MSDKEQIEATIQTYFDSMYESSSEKVHAAFHPNAKITGYMGDRLLELSVPDFANLVGSQQPSPKEQGVSLHSEIWSIETAGDTAVSRVRDEYDGKMFLDTLSLIKDDGSWRIYNKLFHVEGSSS